MKGAGLGGVTLAWARDSLTLTVTWATLVPQDLLAPAAASDLFGAWLCEQLVCGCEHVIACMCVSVEG